MGHNLAEVKSRMDKPSRRPWRYIEATSDTIEAAIAAGNAEKAAAIEEIDPVMAMARDTRPVDIEAPLQLLQDRVAMAESTVQQVHFAASAACVHAAGQSRRPPLFPWPLRRSQLPASVVRTTRRSFVETVNVSTRGST
eukprot:jgi/Tetstr1/460417/TSEL_005679.t1